MGEVGRFLIPRVALRLLGVIHVYLLVGGFFLRSSKGCEIINLYRFQEIPQAFGMTCCI